MKITIAQLNSIVGDIFGNTAKMKRAIKFAARDKSDLIIFPEMFVTGYPPRDLLEKPKFIQDVQKVTEKIVEISKNFPKVGILFGTIIQANKNKETDLYYEQSEQQSSAKHGLYNSAILIYNGKILGEQHKTLLPTYDVFDEARYFDSAEEINVIPFKKEILGISICEDIWNISNLPLKRHYRVDPIKKLVKKGSTILINLSASPFNIGKDKIRYQVVCSHVLKSNLPFIYVNSVGSNDELIFDGKSFIINKDGDLIDVLPSFEEKIKTISLENNSKTKKFILLNSTKSVRQSRNLIEFIPYDEIDSTYKALVLGIKDYIRKCGFKKIVLGLSGGIDSAVTCCLAVKSLGRENVLGLTMPSMYSSVGSVDYSMALAKNLRIKIIKIPINQIYSSYLDTLNKYIDDKSGVNTIRSLRSSRGRNQKFLTSNGVNVAQENIQARIRGNILMAFSNKFNYLVLSAGNKSELAVGYCTLYGDMSGGLSVISDVPKTMVYKLAEYINRKKQIIPQKIISSAPSAELKPDQCDQDTLPPYDILDSMLELYIDKNYSTEEIIAMGFDPKMVNWTMEAVNRNEYKRRQAAPGLKVTSKAFGMGRRMPVAAKYKI